MPHANLKTNITKLIQNTWSLSLTVEHFFYMEIMAVRFCQGLLLFLEINLTYLKLLDHDIEKIKQDIMNRIQPKGE